MIKQPLGQKRLTNIAVVRHKSHGKRFEIACYKNKVKNWRDGIEKDLNEVIQTDTVFENVSQAIIAKEKDLMKAFGTKNLEECCKMILKSGELQVSDREREMQLESLYRDIVQLVVERCVHAQTGRKHTALAVENALKSCGFSVQPDQPAKKQSLKAIDVLCKDLCESFARAQMRLRIVCAEKLVADVRKHLVEQSNAKIEEERKADGGSCSLTFLCDPRQYRDLDKLVTVEHSGEDISLQIVCGAVVSEMSAADSLGTGLGVISGGGYTTATSAAPALASTETAPARSGPKCSSCMTSFEDAAQYRSHCKSEWHNFNLKRKVKSLPPVSEDEYKEIALDVREGFRTDD